MYLLVRDKRVVLNVLFVVVISNIKAELFRVE